MTLQVQLAVERERRRTAATHLRERELDLEIAKLQQQCSRKRTRSGGCPHPPLLQSITLRTWRGMESITHRVWDAFLQLHAGEWTEGMANAIPIINQHVQSNIPLRQQVLFCRRLGHTLVYAVPNTVNQAELEPCVSELAEALRL